MHLFEITVKIQDGVCIVNTSGTAGFEAVRPYSDDLNQESRSVTLILPPPPRSNSLA